MKLKFMIILFVLLSAACNIPISVSPVPTATVSPSPTIPSNTPGLIVRGHVTVNGAGLAGVEVYKRFSAYPWEWIATTDDNGYYESEFIFIPGDEMVSIKVEAARHSFEPPYYYWRHYHGFEETTSDFVASPMP